MISVIGAIAQAITGRMELPQHTCLFYRKDGYSVGAVELDIILDENHSKDAQVTENPLQDGRAISDGIYLELREGTLTGLVSNHSLKHATPPDVQNADSLLDQAKGYTLENRARQAWEDLKAVMDAKQTVTIVTALEVYENVAITHIETTRDGDTGDALAIQIGFRQVQTVQLREDKVSAQVQPSDMESSINRAAAVGTDGGQQVGAQPSPQDMEQLVQGVQ
jgi:hypothetical protein